ncbi:tetratricopeptide repeat-containing sensor histidine kinase [Winogradskyella jejuensis]|uniref:histidine kinase n=1 Tax=Winogradskyella jejuensis TaxID=1089305 RepID=A0A1M5P6G0_9FLAO|nr:tetratricopeptide repeat-containing sensor histidine kinase [Winogradskyella jejuensis]SHG97404.1 Histidine kinase-, DNA gyrase B-, and HSP90-like ATPase [Winogradskyella jejuensis]
MKKFLFISLILIVLFKNQFYAQDKEILDSINKNYWLTKDDNLDVKDRLKFAIEAKKYADRFDVDSIQLRVQRQLALMFFLNENYDSFVNINKENLELASELNDSSAIRVAGKNLGSYYLYIEQNDNSYYYYSKALDYFKGNSINIEKAEILLALADIQQEEKAYNGAEEDAISAIKILNLLPKSEQVLETYWSLYNILGFISENTLNKEKTLEYHDKSISFSKEMEDGFLYEIASINNKANAYRTFGEYERALELYQSLLELKPKYQEEELDFYPTLLINIAKTKLESGDYKFSQTESFLKEAYQSCVDIDYQNGIMAASLELTRLYLKHNKLDLARKYGNETLKKSNEVSNNEYKMGALLELSYLYEDEKGKDYLRQHIRLQDSLQKEERLVSNKFARVKFDTDQIEAQNEQISKENFYLLLLSAGLLLTGTLVYIILSQRAKNKELRLVQEQQKANEEIYNLMLGQQDKVEEARAQEKIRVSKELHDGVLGRLFGARLSLDSLNFSEGKEAMMNRANYIGQLKTIEDDIRKISHEMNTDFVSGSGFMDIVSELIENQTKAYGLTYSFNYTDDFSWEFVPNKTKINIYRILQESMQNIYKHAEAKHVKIDILRKKDEINIYIVDDGKGFDTSKSKKGIGLKNMASRVSDIDGKISYRSQLGKGTSVKVKIPYKI